MPRALACALCALTFCALAGGAAASTGPVTIYLSPSGDDRAAGTEAAPFRTLERARAEIRRLAPAATGDVIVSLRGGRYELERPLRLDFSDSGRNGHRVIWRAYPGETPVVSGGRRIDAWTELPDGEWRARAPGLETRQLYVNGVRALRARGTLPDLATAPSGFTTSDASVASWGNPAGVELVFNSVWTQLRGEVSRISGTTIALRQPWLARARAVPALRLGLPTWVENAHELLDKPGEWYLDRRAGYVYYLPRAREDMRTADVVAPVLETLVAGEGTLDRPLHDVSFEGITFAYATWRGVERAGGLTALQANFAIGPNECYEAPQLARLQSGFKRARICRSFAGSDERWRKLPGNVTMRAAQRVSFTGDRFLHLGGSGLDLADGSRDDSVTGCEFADISGTALQLGDVFDAHPLDARATVAYDEIADNWIHDVAVEYAGGVGIWAGYVAGVRIEHNLIEHLPYTGISVGWGWGAHDPSAAQGNLVARNEVRDFLRVLHDGGGIYVLGAQPGLRVTGNVVSGLRTDGGAVYLDDGARYATVSGNVVWDSRESPFIFKGRDHVIRDNWWDFPSQYGWWWFAGGSVGGNTVIGSLADAPATIVRGAGLEPEYAYLAR